MNITKQLDNILLSIQDRLNCIGDALYRTHTVHSHALKAMSLEIAGVRAVLDTMEPTSSASTNMANQKCPACGSIYIWYSANGSAAKCDNCGHKWSQNS
jgi:ribosomal protein S27E